MDRPPCRNCPSPAVRPTLCWCKACWRKLPQNLRAWFLACADPGDRERCAGVLAEHLRLKAEIGKT